MKRFAIGDAVRTKNVNPDGHTRLPRYLRGCFGEVEAVYRAFPLADAVAAQRPNPPLEPLYTISFWSTDVWEDARERYRITADLFESYLEPAREMPR